MKQELTPKLILGKKRLAVSILALIVCSQFLVVAIFTLISFITSKDITLLFVSLVFFVVSAIILTFRIKPDIKILKGNYIIYEDILKDKDIRISNDTDGGKDTTYFFYFEKLFKLENESIIGDRSSYYDSEIGDKFYIISCGKLRLIFNENQFVVSDKTKITEIPQPSTETTQASIEKKALTKQIIKHDFLSETGQIRTEIFFFILASLFIFIFIMSFYQEIDDKFIAIFMSGFVSIFLLFMFIIKTIYIIQVLSRINKNKFKISTEKITKIGEVAFKDSNSIIKFKFEHYNKYVPANKADFVSIKEGDYCHLVFVEKENTPLKVYNAKNWSKID